MTFSELILTDLFQKRRAMMRQLRDEIRGREECLRMLLNEERREIQEVEMVGDSVRASAGATIDDYCADLIYHAKRLGRPVTGEFNDKKLTARPDTGVGELQAAYWAR